MHRCRWLAGFSRSLPRYLLEQDAASIDLPAKDFYASFSYNQIPEVQHVPGLGVELLPFQREGVGWMVARERSYVGGILADHLGMGKTVQMIGLCLAADAVKQLPIVESSRSNGFRLLTILRQLTKLGPVAACTRLNRPARDIEVLASEIHALIKQGRSDFTPLRNEVDAWLAYAGRLHPVYQQRATAFLNDSADPTQKTYEVADAKVLRTLVIVPAALLFQWKSEIEQKVLPERKITVHVFHGKSKNVSATELENYDFVITTYDTVAQGAQRSVTEAQSEHIDDFDRKKAGPLFQILWKRIVLDEAHVIRHSQTLRWRAIVQLRAAKRWAITATPLHNSIGDLQNLLFFAGCSRLPVLPGTQSQEILDDPVLQRMIAKALQSVFLRRGPVVVRNGVREVLVALPPKQEAVVTRALSPEECDRYNHILSGSRGIIDTQVSTAHVFSLMTKLRLCCSHHWLADSTGVQVYPCGICKSEAVSCVTTKCGHAFCYECLLTRFRDAEDGDHEAARIPCPVCEVPVSSSVLKKKVLTPQQRLLTFKSREFEMSTKLRMLKESVEAMLSGSPTDKMVVFSHFTSFLDVMGMLFDRLNIPYARLDGTMPLTARNSVIKSFQSSDAVRVLIASKTATGVGLNLTAANHVIIIDPWWNPAIEEQAVHRCHRIGQRKPVHVSRFVISDTIEHYCFEIARKKKEFGDAILRAATSGEAGAKSATNKIQDLLTRLNYVGTPKKQ